MALHVQGTDSAARGIPDGWYAISTADAVCSGPFLTRGACEAHIEQEQVKLVREIPEAMKPRAIPIASSTKVVNVEPTKVAA
jgi:hypothetical protein